MDYYIIVRSTFSGKNPLFKRGKRWVKSPCLADCFTFEESYGLVLRLNRLPRNPYFYTFELALPF